MRKIKLYLVFGFIFTAFALTSCQKDDPPTDEATLSVSPATPITFTAAATESFTITVSTNQESWEVSSSQVWCKVAKDGGKFVVTATANTLATAPTPAVITLSAGKAKSVTISVTQAAASTTAYPASEAELKTAITQVWLFPETSDLTSLEFGDNNTYTLLSKVAFVRSGANLFLKSDTYTVGEDLHTITLNNFGEVKINNLSEAQIEMVVTPTGGTATTVTTTKQAIDAPPAVTEKRIKTLDMTDSGEGVYTFTYTQGKLTNWSLLSETVEGPSSLNIPIIYEGNTVKFEVDGAMALGKSGTFKVTYFLNSAGLANYSTIENGAELFAKIYYTYNSSRQLISWRQVNQNGNVIAYCNATWASGNVVSTYSWKTHVCDAEYRTVDGVRYYPHDHNGDGIFTDADKMTFEEWNHNYTYTSDVNKGGYMNTMSMPEIFESSDFFDVLGQWTGVLGVSCKNLMAQHTSGDGDFAYTLDADGYATRLDVSYENDPSGGWYVLMTYE